MKLFNILTILLFVSLTAEARRVHIFETSINTSNTDTSVIEADIRVNNISPNSQKICFDQIVLITFAFRDDANFGSTSMLRNTNFPTSLISKAYLWVDGSPSLSMATTSCITLASKNKLQLVFMSNPLSDGCNSSAAFCPYMKTRESNHNVFLSIPPMSFGGGPYIGYSILKGYIDVSDLNNNIGSVIISGTYISPTVNTDSKAIKTYEFNINNGRPI